MSRSLATKVAWSYINTPYRWGGDDPIEGVDCSGLCIEILKSVDRLPRKGDWTAHGLWERFKSKRTQNPVEGCLVFWWNSAGDRIVHVEYCLDDTHSVGASGGGSATLDEQDAASQNAFVKVRPFRTRSRIAGFADPFMVTMEGFA